jgi:hypothetical protein
MIGKIFESSFSINLFRDINVTRIFYKSSQTCDTYTKDDTYLETEGVVSSFYIQFNGAFYI